MPAATAVRPRLNRRNLPRPRGAPTRRLAQPRRPRYSRLITNRRSAADPELAGRGFAARHSATHQRYAGRAMATVTLVDDEPYALDVLESAARSWRFDCQSAQSAEQALELLEKSPTPLVVTDLRMPGRGGVWLVREIQKRWPEIAIIVLTAGHDTDAVAQCLDAGAHQYFLKPIKLDEFRHALEATLRAHVRQREHTRHQDKLERALARQSRKLRVTFFSAIDSLVRTLEARDPNTSG